MLVAEGMDGIKYERTEMNRYRNRKKPKDLVTLKGIKKGKKKTTVTMKVNIK